MQDILPLIRKRAWKLPVKDDNASIHKPLQQQHYNPVLWHQALFGDPIPWKPIARPISTFKTDARRIIIAIS